MYKLNLPPLDEILSDEGRAKLFVGKDEYLYQLYNPKEILKPEWFKLDDIEWNSALFFYKNNSTGILHIDVPGVWGINWIYQGHGTMEYWTHGGVEFITTEPDAKGNTLTTCTAIKAPIKIYETPPGVYLTDASYPHRASGYAGRYALSLRCYSNLTSWDYAVNKFQHLFR